MLLVFCVSDTRDMVGLSLSDMRDALINILFFSLGCPSGCLFTLALLPGVAEHLVSSTEPHCYVCTVV